jgi:hypothetical protein
MKKIKPKKEYRVYKTVYTDGSYYIGFTSKQGKALASYFGSNKTDKLVDHKDILFVSPYKTDAKIFELLQQLNNYKDPKCLNKMLNVRLRSDHIKDLPIFKIIIGE